MMLLDSYKSESLVEAQWAAFKKYACEPYQANRERCAKIENWFNDLYERRGSGGIALTHHLVTDPRTGRSFETYCINQQIFFSHDAAVLDLPQPSADKGANTISARFVGVLFQDIGNDDVKSLKLYNKNIKRINPKRQFDGYVELRYASNTFSRLKNLFIQSGLPDIAKEHPKKNIFRISNNAPRNMRRHRDSGSDFKFGLWCQTNILHAIQGPGTTYYSGEKEDAAVTIPEGATSAHLSFYWSVFASKETKQELSSSGVLHQATPCLEGRAILISISADRPLTKRSGHWHIGAPS